MMTSKSSSISKIVVFHGRTLQKIPSDNSAINEHFPGKAEKTLRNQYYAKRKFIAETFTPEKVFANHVVDGRMKH
jgi:hypothetical protein